MSTPIQVSSTLESAAAEAMRRSTDYLAGLQAPDGHWCAELTADTTLESDYILFQLWLQPPKDGVWTPASRPLIDKAVRSILERQLNDGGFNIYVNGPSEVSASVKAYFGLKLAGYSADHTALALARSAGDRFVEGEALENLGTLQQLTGDYPAAAASHQQALALFGDPSSLLGQAEALNRLGELATRTADTAQARERHAQALAIARDISVPLEEARAQEGIGNSRLQGGNPGQAAAQLRQALTIYQRIGSPNAQRVRETLRQCGLEQAAHQPTHD